MGTATISFGPKLGLLNNAAINQTYYDQLRTLLQALDQLIMGSVINSTNVVPPVSPNNGDAYLILSTPSGAWTGQLGKIAVWDTQVTNSGTNTLSPAWVFYTPQPGWTLWNVATSQYLLYNGSTWGAIGGGANFPTNTDITSLTGIPNTTINSAGTSFADGTNTVAIGTVTTGGVGPNGFQWGTGTFLSPTTGGAVIIGEGPWTGLDATGAGVGVVVTGDSCVMTAGGIQTNGGVEANAVQSNGTLTVVTGPAYCNNFETHSTNTAMTFTIQGSVTGAPGYVFDTSVLGLTSYPVQTTVGAAGGGSALPATPTGYWPLWINGTEFVVPYYAKS
jgi:hypothetical protein